MLDSNANFAALSSFAEGKECSEKEALAYLLDGIEGEGFGKDRFGSLFIILDEGMEQFVLKNVKGRALFRGDGRGAG